MSMPMDTPGEAQHVPVPVGTRVPTGEPIPRAGTWEIVGHAACPGNGTLHAFARRTAARRCPSCHGVVTWQLSHLAPTVAADHRGVGPLP